MFKSLKNGSVLFCVPFSCLNLLALVFLRTFAEAMKMQRRLRRGILLGVFAAKPLAGVRT
jgi:hypothetical protein